MRVGSLCTGIAGLEHGLELAGIDVEPVFVSDIDRGACDWLAANMPDTPNLGDFTALDSLPEVDLLTAGFPCQPVSTAGKRAGIEDERWLFDDICRLVSRMETRPLLFLENVPGLLTANDRDAFSRVVYGLAAIGYHITWGALSAAAVGAPHRRLRWWGLAYPADTAADTERIRNRSGQGSLKADGAPLRAFRRSATPADACGVGWQPRSRSRPSQPASLGRDGPSDNTRTAAADADSAGSQGRPVHAERRNERDTRPRSLETRFGQYADAVHRWEHILGRAAPDPTDDGRLNAAFVEWMMGYPEGWVTDTLTRRTHALHALGNAVVPQCASEAFTQLTARIPTWPTSKTSTSQTTADSPASSSSAGTSTKTNP